MNSRNIIWIVLGLVVLLLIVFLAFRGERVEVLAVNSFDDCVQAGYEVRETDPAICVTPDGRVFTQESDPVTDEMIRVFTPSNNQTISSPLVVSGEARGGWYFEADFPVRLLDANGNEIAVAPATAQGDWMTEEFVPFTAELTFSPPQTPTGTLVLERSNPSGLAEHADERRIPVRFAQYTDGSGAQTTSFLVHFPHSGRGSDDDCSLTFAVIRTVPQTQAVARASLNALLSGPTADEIAQGYSTSINPGVQIQSLTIDNGVARVDFSSELEEDVGGSCRVISIRSQIEETLMQFPTVNEVEISIDGRSEDILQP